MPDRTQAPPGTLDFSFIIPEAVSTKVGETPVHVIQAGKQPVIKLEVVFRAGGSIHDSLKGQSFMTNKMLLHGTASRTTDDISEQLDRFGAFVRLVPSFDDPIIELYCLTKHLDEILPILQDIIANSIFPENEYELVRDITVENLQIQNSKNNVLASKSFRNRLFGSNHPYGKVLEATDINALSAEDLRQFFSKQLSTYELIVTGDVKDVQLASIEKHLCFSSAYSETTQSYEVDTLKGEFYDEKENSLQTSLRIGALMPHKSHPDYNQLRICLHALGGYFGSRLMKNIREDKGFTYGIYASLVPLVHRTYMMIGTDVQKASRDEAISEIYKEISRMQEEPLPAGELEMVKNHLLGSFQSELDSPLALSSKFKGVYYFGLDYSYYQRLIDTIRDIRAADIQDMAIKYLQTPEFTEVSVG
jgi:predicted Zn-dependent peptidase